MFWRLCRCHGLWARTIRTPPGGSAEAPAPEQDVAVCAPGNRVGRTMGSPVLSAPVRATLDTGAFKRRFAALIGTPVRLLSTGARDAFTWADARPGQVIMTSVVEVRMVATALGRDEGETSPLVLLGWAGLRQRCIAE